MKKTLLFITLIFILFSGSYILKKINHESEDTGCNISARENSHKDDEIVYKRIISLAPSITEILFKLNLGDRVAGVTRYCDYPPPALNKVKIGGYYDPNYEAIVSLQPDLIIMLPEHEKPKEYLSKLGYQILIVNHKSIFGILDSILTIGKICGAENKAMDVTKDIKKRMENIRLKTESLHRPNVMISVGRNMGSGSFKDAYISGSSGFYNEMIGLAGGVNAYCGEIAFPVVTAESIIRLNPDVIIDMVPDLEEKGLNEEIIRKEWDVLFQVDAVKNGKVHVFSEDFVVIPGPRFILILEKMARVIHPGVGWN